MSYKSGTPVKLGRVTVGYIYKGMFCKEVSRSKHFMRLWGSWNNDVSVYNKLGPEVKYLCLHEVEEDVLLYISREDYDLHKKNYSHGSSQQYAVYEKHWTKKPRVQADPER